MHQQNNAALGWEEQKERKKEKNETEEKKENIRHLKKWIKQKSKERREK